MHPPAAHQIADAVRTRQTTAVDVITHALARIDALNPRLNAFTQVFRERSLERARAIDALVSAAVARGDSRALTGLPLAGVPVAIKDNICLDHGLTSCASRILENYRSPFTATALERLEQAGAIAVGKTNLDEFAMGSSTEHSIHGPTRNPWDISRVPGGSSGGSAAAVAARIVPLALGSDTGGSIRQPAGLCGVVGIKPTYGRVSRYGLVAYASSLDQIGPISTTVADAAICLNAICGVDARDSTTADRQPEHFDADLDAEIPRLKIGIPRQARSDANHPDVSAALDAAASVLAQHGAQIADIDLPLSDQAIAAYYIVAPAEASSNLARFDGVRYGRRAERGHADSLENLYRRSRAEGFGPEVRRRIMLGTHVLSSGYYDAYYTRALKVRRRIKQEYDAAFAAGCHAILMPTAPNPAFRLGEKTADPLAMYLEDVYTVGVNLAGLPAISVPAGFSNADGATLPIGMQLVGAAFDEATLLRIARLLERHSPHGATAPPQAP